MMAGIQKKKGNLVTIQHAISKALEGAANHRKLTQVQNTIQSNSEACNQFLILFRNRQHFSGLYKYEEGKDLIHKLDGTGPATISIDDILQFYKFESSKRQFTEVQTRHVGLTIVGFTIKDHIWPRRPSSHR